MQLVKVAGLTCAALLATCLLMDVGCLADAPDEGKFVQLFDGQSLYGWHPTTDANWHVADGSITVDSGTAGFLMTELPFDDFELTLQFEAAPTTNSGVFLRSIDDPQNPQSDCYEVNITGPSNPFPLGSLVARQRGSKVPELTEKWQSMAIRAEAGQLDIAIDGMPITTFKDPHPLSRGKVGLQFNQGSVRFRQIQIRPLSMQLLWNGHDLEGWRTAARGDGIFEVADGQLRVRSGPGQLETTSSFDDFLLQVECRTNASRVNSGLFFRCIPREPLMGYECQIHHGYRDGDRSRPTDSGTGAIFRRQEARRVVANDLEWFDLTIAAAADQFATWVNGVQVTCWKDTRAVNPNPRMGKRLNAGTIMIQAHDPATDVSFRQMRIHRIRKDRPGK